MHQAISTHKIHLTGIGSYAPGTSVITGLINKFMAWCAIQEKNSFLWLAVALVGGIAAVLPLTLIAVVFGAHNNFILWIIVCIINVPILVVNLAVQPTTVKLPVLFFAWTINAIIIGCSLLHLFIK